MSAAASEDGGVLKPFLLRSSTPATNEKVLKYLESMKDSADASPPASIVDNEEYRERSMRSPTSDRKGSKHNSEGRRLEDPAGSQLSYTNQYPSAKHAEDAESTTFKAPKSEGGHTEVPQREPGPGDPPGPRYESYDSGPSFGNFGPLPIDDQLSSSNPFAHASWQPNWGNAMSSVNENKAWGASVNGGLTPGYPKVPLPESIASPRATSVEINVESPSSPRSKVRNSQTPSKRSPSAISENDGRAATQVDAHTSQSRAPRAPVDKEMEPPLSPLSLKSRLTTKTRATERGTAYPALPESIVGDGYTNVPSPPLKSKAYSPSKAPSISPSDSPSQMKVQKSVSKSQSGHKSTHAGAEFSPRSGSRQILQNGGPSHISNMIMSGGKTHQDRPFSPYRHAATQEDLLHAAIRGRAFAFPPSPISEKAPTVVSHKSKVPSVVSLRRESSVQHHGKPTSVLSTGKQPYTQIRGSKQPSNVDGDVTPTPTRPHSPIELNADEEQIVQDALARNSSALTPRTSYYASSTLEPEVVNSHFHDMELCVLLHQQNDPDVHEVIKRALRKAVRQRVKKLGMKHDSESIKQYKQSFHDHDPSVHLQPDYSPSIPDEPPEWAKELIQGMVVMQQRIEGLGPKIEGLKAPQNRSFGDGSRFHGIDYNEDDDFSRTPLAQTVNIHTQPTGTLADSMFQPAETEIIEESNPGQTGSQIDGSNHNREETEFKGIESHGRGFPLRGPQTDGETYTHQGQTDFMSELRDDSPGQQFLEEELYKLRQKPQGSHSPRSHRTWEVARDDDDEEDEDPEVDYEEGDERGPPASGLPTIPDSTGAYTERRPDSPPLPAIPQEGRRDIIATPQQLWHTGDYSIEAQQLPPWQRIHQRLLSWAIIWPLSELDNALNSTTRGHQVDEVALSIWSTQTYKRYVRTRMTDSPQGVVDRLFVPPNMADAISTAVFNGRHGDACGMLRDLWSPFGLEGMPRLLVVLAKHRSDENHWVVHRFSLPDGALTTYDSYPERTLPDGRPLGWWFAIRVAWPNAIYPSPDHLMQKMVRLHRPMQLNIDNSVAAAGIWRNILMGSRAERSLDLERLRDLINTEVKNLRQRKQMGKLSIGAPRPAWEDMN